jgi:tetratricopeptide (TPR) repeat protein
MNRWTAHSKIGFLFLVFAGLLYSNVCIAQHPNRKKIDSLLKKLIHSYGDDKADVLNSLSEEYWWFPYPKPDSILFYSRQANAESYKNNYTDGIARSILHLGVGEMYRRNYAVAEKYIRQCISLSEPIHDEKSFAWGNLYLGYILYLKNEFSNAETSYDNATPFFEMPHQEEGKGRLCSFKSILYMAMGEYGKAFEYCRKTLEVRKKMDDHVCVVAAYNNFGNLYKAAGDYETALAYYYQSQHYANDNKIAWNENEQLGSIFCSLQKYDSSFYYLFLSLKKFPENPDLWLSLSQTYLARKEYDSSLKISLFLIDKYRNSNDKLHLTTTLIDAGRALEGKHNNLSALEFASAGLGIALQANARQSRVDVYQLLSKIYSNLGKIDSAFAYLNKYSLLRDSVLTKKFLSRLNLYENEAEVQIKQAQLDLLDKDNRMKKAQLGQQSLMNAVLIGSLLSVILLGIIIFRNILLRRNNEKLESKRQLAELQQKASEFRMETLRAQMNPHFIFNSLNSINRFILQSDKSQASEYLTKFSRLMRLIMQNSQSALIPLAAEIESLRLYLELEAIRFNHRFEYQIDVDRSIEVDFIKVPPLLIQPFVENAIWHGLMQKREKGQLQVQIYPENGSLLLIVRDNGIGRRQASIFSGKSSTRHHSMGLKLTAERIDLLQHSKDKKPKVVINDLVNDDGSSGGTEVVVQIPSLYG